MKLSPNPGLLYTTQLSLVSGFLSGLSAGTLLEVFSGDPKSFNKGFASGFWAGFVGGIATGLGLRAGATEGAEMAVDSPEANVPKEEDVGPSLDNNFHFDLY